MFDKALLPACAISFLLGTYLSIGKHENAATSTVVEKDNTGWRQVDVFYGDSSLLSRQVNGSLWTSQLNQDQIVFQFLGKGGYFLDLASNDATFLSNTYSLETHHGWNGLCIEANPQYWLGLAGRRCQVVGAVLGHQTMEEIQFKYGTKLQSGQKRGEADSGLNGGIVNPAFDNKNPNDWDIIESRFTVRLEDVFRRYKVPLIIDYFSLDVEGAETYIMSSFPFDSYRIKVMTVERPKADLVALLQKNGYIFLGYLSGWGESLWCHESIKPTLNLSGIPFFESAFLPTITSGAGQNTTPHLEPHNMK